jgi:hypothetical protein
MRNKCTQAIWKAKVSYFKEQFSLCVKFKKFWKMVKDLENKPSSSQLPMSLNVDDVVVTDKEHMALMITSLSQDSYLTPCPPNISSSPTPSDVTIPDSPPSCPPDPLQSFPLQVVTDSEVLKELLDPKKTPGSYGLDPFFFKVAGSIMAKHISNLFNMSLLSGEVPIAWKAATVRPLFKGSDRADPNCLRPISILPCLSKVLEKCVNNQLTGFLDVYSIFLGMPSGLRSRYGCVNATIYSRSSLMSPLPLNLSNVVLLFLLTWPNLLIRLTITFLWAG